MRIAALIAIAGLSGLAIPSVAAAQSLDLDLVAEQHTVDDETIAAVTLYASGGASVVAGSVMLVSGIFELNAICSGTCDDGGTLFIGGIVTASIGAIALFVAVGLSIDAALRGGRIDARRRAVTFDGTLTVRWDG